jgi:hypothetical protein
MKLKRGGLYNQEGDYTSRPAPLRQVSLSPLINFAPNRKHNVAAHPKRRSSVSCSHLELLGVAALDLHVRELPASPACEQSSRLRPRQ